MAKQRMQPLPQSAAPTIGAALQQAMAFLPERGGEETRAAVEWLFSHELRCGRLELHQRQAEALPPLSRRRIAARLRRLAAGEPLQYVLGNTVFMGHPFKSDARALIPRPETEELTAQVLSCTPLWQRDAPVIADVGTGSGCIIISLALAKPEGLYLAIDLDPQALALAKENARRLGVEGRIRFSQGNLLEALPAASLEAVISNPPYVSTSAWQQLPTMIREHEPRLALDGGSDGLEVMRPLIVQAARALKPGGWLFLEISAEQGPALRALLSQQAFGDIILRRDLAGHERLVTARRGVILRADLQGTSALG